MGEDICNLFIAEGLSGNGCITSSAADMAFPFLNPSICWRRQIKTALGLEKSMNMCASTGFGRVENLLILPAIKKSRVVRCPFRPQIP